MNQKKCRKKKRKAAGSKCEDIKDLGFVMLVFGIVTICAFVLPVKAWILLLGCILMICGIRLYCK
ncbi:MAG: hypothetical protein HFE76_12095 [Firmicutes bacterium]|nr:hypothetical protein [Bacillota bacterium]